MQGWVVIALLQGVQLFTDDSGDVAQLHGIGVQRVGQRWYVYGEIKGKEALFRGISCYSTVDFAHWHNEGVALPVGKEGSITGSERIIERPKVMQCPATGHYVMYLHVDGKGDYEYAHIGIAISDTPQGPFAMLSTMQFRGYESRDIGVFQDEDGVGYLLSEDRAHGTHIYRLSDDYLSIVGDVVCLHGEQYWAGYESPTLIKCDGVYYWFGSQLTGWDCNDNMVATATDLHGPWSHWQLFAPVGSCTFESQCDMIVPLGENQWHSERFMYIGDRWNRHDLGNSPLVTLPITISDRIAKSQWFDEWDNGL